MPFGLGALWENWKNPSTGEWERTFAIITVPSNELVGQIHNRMPAILEPQSYNRWLCIEPNVPSPRGLVGCIIGPSAPSFALSATPTLIIRDFCVIVVPIWVPSCVFCRTESGEFSVLWIH